MLIEAYDGGVTIRKDDALVVPALGSQIGISKAKVTRIYLDIA